MALNWKVIANELQGYLLNCFDTRPISNVFELIKLLFQMGHYYQYPNLLKTLSENHWQKNSMQRSFSYISNKLLLLVSNIDMN